MRLSEERYDNPAYRDIKIRLILQRKKAEKKVLPKKSWPPQSVFSAWGSHKNKLPKVQVFLLKRLKNLFKFKRKQSPR